MTLWCFGGTFWLIRPVIRCAFLLKTGFMCLLLPVLMLIGPVLGLPAPDLRVWFAFFGTLKLGVWFERGFYARLLFEIELGSLIEALGGNEIQRWLEFKAAGIKIGQIQAIAKGALEFPENEIGFAGICGIFIRFCGLFAFF